MNISFNLFFAECDRNSGLPTEFMADRRTFGKCLAFV